MAAIGLGNLQIEPRLPLSLVLGLDDPTGFVGVDRLQAGALAGGFIHAIEHSAPVAPVD